MYNIYSVQSTCFVFFSCPHCSLPLSLLHLLGGQWSLLHDASKESGKRETIAHLKNYGHPLFLTGDKTKTQVPLWIDTRLGIRRSGIYIWFCHCETFDKLFNCPLSFPVFKWRYNTYLQKWVSTFSSFGTPKTPKVS